MYINQLNYYFSQETGQGKGALDSQWFDTDQSNLEAKKVKVIFKLNLELNMPAENWLAWE